MSEFMKNLVSQQACGQANPLQRLAEGGGGGGAVLQHAHNARSFAMGGAQQPQLMPTSAPVQQQPQQPQQQSQPPQLAPQLEQQQAAMNMLSGLQAPPVVQPQPELVNQFRDMHVQPQPMFSGPPPQSNLMRVFQQGGVEQSAPNDWLQKFSGSRQAPQTSAPPPGMMRSGPPMMQFQPFQHRYMGGPMMMQPQMMQQQSLPPQQQQQQQQPQQTQQDTSDQKQVGGGGGGVSETVEYLKNSDNPKFRNSKFLAFAQRYQNGEIDLVNNQVVEVPEDQREKVKEAREYEGLEQPEAPNMADLTAEDGGLAGEEWTMDDGPSLEEIVGDADAGFDSNAYMREVEKLRKAQHEWFSGGQQGPPPMMDMEAVFKAAGEETTQQQGEQQPWQSYDWNNVLQQAKNAPPGAQLDPQTGQFVVNAQSTPQDQYVFDTTNQLLSGFLSDAGFDSLESMRADQKEGQESKAENQAHQWYKRGLKEMKAGRIRDAIRSFEACVQLDPEHAEAWRYLGQAHAENESDEQAIAALRNCIREDPYNLPALLMLGVSYTNDLEEDAALKYLNTWLEHHPDYAELSLEAKDLSTKLDESSEQNMGSGLFNSTLHARLVQKFLRVAHKFPQDADLHQVLGVLYHISSDYDKSIEAFHTAAKLRPQDPYLWNKLGAAQANSQHPDEAKHTYKKALRLRPTYVRAIANLGIAFANTGDHRGACNFYLSALDKNPNAEHIWSFLRISLTDLGEEELLRKSYRREVAPFRELFDF